MRTTRKALILILLSSLSAGIGQLLWKKASFSLSLNPASFLNLYLILGIILYIFATILMIFAFREGELSVLHPFLATSYVWVALISPVFFMTETLSLTKILAIISIFLGVYMIGLGGKKAHD